MSHSTSSKWDSISDSQRESLSTSAVLSIVVFISSRTSRFDANFSVAVDSHVLSNHALPENICGRCSLSPVTFHNREVLRAIGRKYVGRNRLLQTFDSSFVRQPIERSMAPSVLLSERIEIGESAEDRTSLNSEMTAGKLSRTDSMNSGVSAYVSNRPSLDLTIRYVLRPPPRPPPRLATSIRPASSNVGRCLSLI